MLDITDKYPTLRTATAEAVISLKPDTLAAIRKGGIPKGDPLEVARAAAVLAAKNTANIIPYCHPIQITHVKLDYELGEDTLTIRATVKALAPTGVEMEALTAASVAALTVYDMLKMLDDALEIRGIRLLEKKGGKNDFRDAPDRQLTAAVLVMSDSVAAGKKSDASGRLIRERLEREGFDVADYTIISDEPDEIARLLIRYSDELKLDLVLTTGGTGLGPRDSTPEAMGRVIEREVPGLAEVLRSYGQGRTPFAMLSRARAGLRGGTLIVNLPGSQRAVTESLNQLFPALLHAFRMMRGEGGWQ